MYITRQNLIMSVKIVCVMENSLTPGFVTEACIKEDIHMNTK
jgi:hypothetical protein